MFARQTNHDHQNSYAWFNALHTKREKQNRHFKSSMLGSIPHHSTFMVKKGVQSWVCMTNTKLKIFNAGYNVLRTKLKIFLWWYLFWTFLILSWHQQSWFFHDTNNLDSFTTPTFLILSQHQHSLIIFDSFTTWTFFIPSQHQYSSIWFFHNTNILNLIPSQH